MSKEDLIGKELLITREDGQEVSMRLSDDDPALSVTPSDIEAVITEPLLQGLDVPTKKRGKMTALDEERWLVVVETLMQRGVKSVRDASRLTGLTESYTTRLVKDVKERWSKSLTTGQVNVRREAIYLEAERVKEACWEQLKFCTNDGMRLSLFKLILEAGQRQASLIGANKLAVSIETDAEAMHKSAAQMEAEVIDELGLSPEEIKNLGTLISQRMLPPGEED